MGILGWWADRRERMYRESPEFKAKIEALNVEAIKEYWAKFEYATKGCIGELEGKILRLQGRIENVEDAVIDLDNKVGKND
jgi:hypothetical protein